MSTKAILECDGKQMLAKFFGSKNSGEFATGIFPLSFRISSQVSDGSTEEERSSLSLEIARSLAQLEEVYKQVLANEKLVVKLDQCVKRRGKSGLVAVNLTWEETKRWLHGVAGTKLQVGNVCGFAKCFLIEPFIPHSVSSDENYLCMRTGRDADEILFSSSGGVNVGDVEEAASKISVSVGEKLSLESVTGSLLKNLPSGQKRNSLALFIVDLYDAFVTLNFSFLEINPLVWLPSTAAIRCLDLAAKLDMTAEFECAKLWGPLQQTTPFGYELTKEERYIQELDAKTGASLKLTVLNESGSIWTMIAGGGASVVYTDAIVAAGCAPDLANYGEYSGAPNEIQTYEYAKTILSLMLSTPPKYPEIGKILIIGGGIANFTNVAATFKGIIRAIKELHQLIASLPTTIYVRRGGPNYREGLELMRELGTQLGLSIQVYGPETHITAIVPKALAPLLSFKGTKVINPSICGSSISPSLMKSSVLDGNSDLILTSMQRSPHLITTESLPPSTQPSSSELSIEHSFLTKETQCLVYGLQIKAIQSMLDFDYLCLRKIPSVAAIVYPFGGGHCNQRFYWGRKEFTIHVYPSIKEAIERHTNANLVVNFASCRSVFDSCIEFFNFAPQVRTIAIVAEGVPERKTRLLIKVAEEHGVRLIGPATVGGIRAGSFKIGNTGGMVDNIVFSRLYRPGSVSYVSKSGGMSNELNSLISQFADGVCEGIAIGGDRFPGSTFIDHMLRFEEDPICKIIVLLGEVGGVEEMAVCEAIKSERFKKPIIAWCIGTCASQLGGGQVQFGHAGAFANCDQETSVAKNQALRMAGCLVPDTFEEFPATLSSVYQRLLSEGVIKQISEPLLPKVPVDYEWAQELGLVRKPPQVTSTICDERGQELTYSGMAISEIFRQQIGIGGVISLLWFKRTLPEYATHFIEIILILTADHGPAVSGAHNTIVTTRAGKDLVSSLVAGLLTIGERFGGALDGAAQQFSEAYDAGMSANEFVVHMKRKNQYIQGIGHKVKSIHNPDNRVRIIHDYVLERFPNCPLFKFALEVEMVTTKKKDNLILNVDGVVATAFVDILRYSGAFSREEADDYITMGSLNALFVLGRSIGFIGHHLDQKRLKQGLYRHPWDDIAYSLPINDFSA